MSRTAVIRGTDLRNARPARMSSASGRPTSLCRQDGAARFGRFTEANIGNRLAVVLDNQIRSVATIQASIEDSGRITGLGGEQEATNLSLVLRSGSLPAGIMYLEERTVGPRWARILSARGLSRDWSGCWWWSWRCSFTTRRAE